MAMTCVASTMEEITDGVSRLRCQVEGLLQHAGYLALRDIACEADDGIVFLHGRLPSYYLKQVAQALAASAEGVRYVVNHIDVVPTRGRAPHGHDPARRNIPQLP